MNNSAIPQTGALLIAIISANIEKKPREKILVEFPA